jgi:outer membrane protein OmpA-like peptidoglycan-associated protein
MKRAVLYIGNVQTYSCVVMLIMVMLCTSCLKNELLGINQSVRLENIYFEYDKWEILPEAEKDLFDLKELLVQNPTVVIEISSHTDTRGASKYNQQLSQERADATKHWLVNAGIPEQRIVSIGYGEEKLINNCQQRVNCSEEQHAFNRRTEFKIIEGPQEIEISNSIFNQNAN